MKEKNEHHPRIVCPGNGLIHFWLHVEYLVTLGGNITVLRSLFRGQVWLKEMEMGVKLTKGGLVTVYFIVSWGRLQYPDIWSNMSKVIFREH